VFSCVEFRRGSLRRMSYFSQRWRIFVTTFSSLYNTIIVGRPLVAKLIIMQSPCNTVMLDQLLSVRLGDVIIYMRSGLPPVFNFLEVWRAVPAADETEHNHRQHHEHQPQQQQKQQQQQAHRVATAFLAPPPPSPPPSYSDVILIVNRNDYDIIVTESESEQEEEEEEEDGESEGEGHMEDVI